MIFEFDDISIEQICTHRVDMETLYLDEDVSEWEARIHATRHTHYPVCKENQEEYRGNPRYKRIISGWKIRAGKM